MDSLGRVAAVITAVILLFLFPLRYDAAAQEHSAHSYLIMEMEHFWYDICTEKRLTTQMYQEFCQAISQAQFTGAIYIERYQPVIYSAETLEEGKESGEIKNSTEYVYDNLIECLKEQGEIELNRGDYVMVYLEQREETIMERLSNLLIPFYLYPEENRIGGQIN